MYWFGRKVKNVFIVEEYVFLFLIDYNKFFNILYVVLRFLKVMWFSVLESVWIWVVIDLFSVIGLK